MVHSTFPQEFSCKLSWSSNHLLLLRSVEGKEELEGIYTELFLMVCLSRSVFGQSLGGRS